MPHGQHTHAHTYVYNKINDFLADGCLTNIYKWKQNNQFSRICVNGNQPYTDIVVSFYATKLPTQPLIFMYAGGSCNKKIRLSLWIGWETAMEPHSTFKFISIHCTAEMFLPSAKCLATKSVSSSALRDDVGHFSAH